MQTGNIHRAGKGIWVGGDQMVILSKPFVMGKMTCFGSYGIKYLAPLVTVLLLTLADAVKAHQTAADVSTADTMITDKDGHHYAVKTMQDGSVWMTTNLQTALPGSFCYADAADSCVRYGRLYTWKVAQEACALLGNGWRLPTAAEWRNLTWRYGQFAGDTVAARKLAFQQLMVGGAAGFGAVLGGGRDPYGGYKRGAAHGFYWTATATESTMAWFGNFAKGSKALYLQPDGEQADAFSVRCVQRR